jgi:Flp pilus assembly protein CpaB
MKSRGLVVAIAVLLAIVAAAGVVLYTNGVKSDAVNGGALSTVVVAHEPIPANTNLNPLIDQGVFGDLQVPTDAVVEGAVTNINELRGQTTTSPILANEQIAIERLSSGDLPEGGTLGISDGNVAVSLRVSDEAGVNGAITRGSYITIYASFDNVKLLPGNTPEQQVQAATNAADKGGVLPSITITLIPAVRVLEAVNPIVSEDGSRTTNAGQVTLTLDLTPADAQNLVYAQQNGVTWIGMLPPRDTEGHPIPFSTVPLNRVLGKGAA